jgi:hypothetical protein
MYGYELLKTFPPTMNDTIHHVGWIALTCFAYLSPLATQGSTHIPMIRCIAVCSFFSLGVNSVVLLGLFLMLHLGPSWTSPPRWMCRAYSVLTWIMCLSRPVEWLSYLIMVNEFWKVPSHVSHYLILIAISWVLIGLCDLHRKWSLRSLKYSRDLWTNYVTEMGREKDSHVGTFVLSQMGSVVVEGNYWMVVGALTLPQLLRFGKMMMTT